MPQYAWYLSVCLLTSFHFLKGIKSWNFGKQMPWNIIVSVTSWELFQYHSWLLFGSYEKNDHGIVLKNSVCIKCHFPPLSIRKIDAFGFFLHYFLGRKPSFSSCWQCHFPYSLWWVSTSYFETEVLINLPTFKHCKHISISNEARPTLETPTLAILDSFVPCIGTSLNFLHDISIINNELVKLSI